ncbi:MAG: histidine kinase [Candidatus Margulisiibacteriota bacterium]|nr:MAG: histidine kinase [Candidatus Margulisbacteria bacterium GWD2_39_127]OGI01326.1 MAG: histidine kinase [Candidatus Margulisbacteria bacterium GWF2_38_17]OGI10790.1 MAG: histidine kinase [Candidatus Margulisbacteria bacterium GWE2_39_32]PZM79394.1 MAG: histidine kinase [Candidatus Margulisiibacteriota bacterium]HAR63556.1 histidine kinase [Candidatus Margulisiibacteriota bacterium]
MDTSEEYKEAQARVRQLREFYSHMATYIVVNLGLFLINIITAPHDIWFYWVVIGWGIGLISHAFRVFGISGIFGPEWEEKKIKELMEKDKQKK